MKKWFAVTAIFISSYLVFLVSTMPLAFLINTIDLPKKVNVGAASGTIWNGEIAHVAMGNDSVKKIKTQLSFWSFFMLSPKADISFGDAITSGPEGKLTVSVSFSQVSLTDVELFIPANDIAKNLRLPIPVTAQGNAEITFKELSLNTSETISCAKAQGQVNWKRAGVIALDQTVTLGGLSVDLDCDKGDITAKVSPKNNVGLDLNARYNIAKQKASGQGYLKPGAKFPAELKPALSFLGRIDNQGRYKLKF